MTSPSKICISVVTVPFEGLRIIQPSYKKLVSAHFDLEPVYITFSPDHVATGAQTARETPGELLGLRRRCRGPLGTQAGSLDNVRLTDLSVREDRSHDRIWVLYNGEDLLSSFDPDSPAGRIFKIWEWLCPRDSPSSERGRYIHEIGTYLWVLSLTSEESLEYKANTSASNEKGWQLRTFTGTLAASRV